MTPAQITRLLYGPHPGPEGTAKSLERLIREFGASAVYGHARTAKRDAPAAHPHDDTPLAYLDALCRIEAARAARKSPEAMA